MRIHFWGTRGSVPAAPDCGQIHAKILSVLEKLRDSGSMPSDGEAWLESLPFALRGTYGGNTACVTLEDGGEPMICDAGTGLRAYGQSVRPNPGEGSPPCTYHLFVSHPHWDHIQGFPFFTPAFTAGTMIHIYGGHSELEDAFTGQQTPPFFPVPLATLPATIRFHRLERGQVYGINGFQVRIRPQNHPGNSYGYSFQKDGRKVVYATDSEHRVGETEQDDTLLEFFDQADVLIFDAQYSLLDTLHSKENWGHSSNLIGVELAVLAGVKRLCLFHMDPSATDQALDQFLLDTKRYLQCFDSACSLAIYLAYDGYEISL